MSDQRRWLVPEQVQTSAMDCGPAALAALLAGHGIHVSYGRLREACQTSVDGTSVDTIEEVAVALGLEAEQVMQPLDFLLLPEAAALPALAVVTLPSGATHFIVIWDRVGPWVQVMDPAVGRRWRRWEHVAREIYIHEMLVPAEAWRDWALSDEAQATWGRAMSNLGLEPAARAAMISRAVAAPGWRDLATLDAAIRLAGALVRAGGLAPGEEAGRLIAACLDPADADDADDALPGGLIPPAYWFARPAPPGVVGDEGEELLRICGAVIVRARGRRAAASEDLPPDLVAALGEPPPRPGRMVLQLVGRDGWLSPGLLTLAVTVAAAGVSAEALLFQSFLSVGTPLLHGEQRGSALLAVGVFLTALCAVVLLSSRLARIIGARLELRLRIALLEKLPHLGSRYFHSRLVSDMARRAHGLRAIRALPAIVAGAIQTGTQLLITTVGLIWINPAGGAAALALSAAFVLLMLAMTPAMSEHEQRVQAHSGALSQIHLDSLLGLAPLRLHGAERSMQREHEQILASWWRAGQGLALLSALGQAGAGILYTAFAVAQVVTFLQDGGGERVLLLLYWTLSLPVLAQGVIMAVQEYPGLRARVLTLIEPLGAPDEDAVVSQEPADPAPIPGARGVAITLQGVTVQAGGHTILSELDLQIAPGEQIAVVGPSGAGKSSLVGVLLGWHTPVAGRCDLDGCPLDGVAIRELRAATAWVDPAVQLWNRSLLANLTYGRADEAASPRVIEQAELLGLLERLPAGMQTRLGEGGGLVSGGEGQRVRLGRALGLSEPRLVVLDEPFRGLDRGQRAGLLARVRELWAGATMICITHDVVETLGFTRVLVVEGGRIVEDGAPAALAAAPESRYRALLDAEERVRREGWGNPAWRRVRLAGGVLEELV